MRESTPIMIQITKNLQDFYRKSTNSKSKFLIFSPLVQIFLGFNVSYCLFVTAYFKMLTLKLESQTRAPGTQTPPWVLGKSSEILKTPKS